MAGHEGRGIGLWAKAATYLLQDAGENTYQANRSLGLPDDSRDFTDAAAILHYFIGADKLFRLLTNNPKKLDDLPISWAVPNRLTTINIAQPPVLADWNRSYRVASQSFFKTSRSR